MEPSAADLLGNARPAGVAPGFELPAARRAGVPESVRVAAERERIRRNHLRRQHRRDPLDISPSPEPEEERPSKRVRLRGTKTGGASSDRGNDRHSNSHHDGDNDNDDEVDPEVAALAAQRLAARSDVVSGALLKTGEAELAAARARLAAERAAAALARKQTKATARAKRRAARAKGATPNALAASVLRDMIRGKSGMDRHLTASVVDLGTSAPATITTTATTTATTGSGTAKPLPPRSQGRSKAPPRRPRLTFKPGASRKVPHNTRCKKLNLLIDALLKSFAAQTGVDATGVAKASDLVPLLDPALVEAAYTEALALEDGAFTKSRSKQTYANEVTNAILRIRKDV